MDMRTDLTAGPHASLRNPKRKPESERQGDVVACKSADALALYQRLKFVQVQVVDQTTHPPKCHSFGGLDRPIGSSPPAKNSFKKNPCDYKEHTHKNLPRMGPSHEVILTHCNMHPLGLLLAVILSFGMLLPPILQLQDRRPRQGRDKVAGPRQTEPRRVSER